MDEDGYLWLTGRYKDIIKTGGENVSALEVEDWLVNRIPSVEAAKVVGVPDERWGEAVVAFVELGLGEEMTAGQIIDHCKHELSAYKVPKHVFFVKASEWPVSSAEMLKVRKDVLQARAQALIRAEPVS
jgi:fatty-acyl-CoA synthase